MSPAVLYEDVTSLPVGKNMLMFGTIDQSRSSVRAQKALWGFQAFLKSIVIHALHYFFNGAQYILFSTSIFYWGCVFCWWWKVVGGIAGNCLYGIKVAVCIENPINN